MKSNESILSAALFDEGREEIGLKLVSWCIYQEFLPNSLSLLYQQCKEEKVKELRIMLYLVQV
jgi:hypothetical protein